MSVYPKWMEARCKKGCPTIPPIIIPPDCPDGGGGRGGGGGGGGMTIAYRDRPLPKVRIKLVKDEDLHANINITILKVVDMSLTGGTE
jgi:hypothetical protein